MLSPKLRLFLITCHFLGGILWFLCALAGLRNKDPETPYELFCNYLVVYDRLVNHDYHQVLST